MKWKNTQRPHNEKIYTYTKFLWFPTACPDELIRWLVRVEIIAEHHCNWAGAYDKWLSVKEM
jgi:hypothetical protein